MEDFIKKWDGKICTHPKGIRGQCVCLYRLYLDYLGAPQSPPVRGAKDLWGTYPEGHFERLKRKLGRLPQYGDIVIFDAFPGNPYGHVGMVTRASLTGFESFDSNWSIPLHARLEKHSYKYVIGWLRPMLCENEKEEIQKLNTEIGRVTDERDTAQSELVDERAQHSESIAEKEENYRKWQEEIDKRKATEKKLEQCKENKFDGMTLLEKFQILFR